ncbi:hypothetical protein JFL43_09980 [Viridibacillus sp. YIM B01967]|uniref:Uncharacterized protein n=1 Tax=Viridibacillus soli TaxID=2798301 RepID=A0ABS1H6X7_9BACL|nr:hypothetical protein [Viridibacillus soli]MBK3495176.1 hypothetical protein [Viridibacillus soli]
MKKIILIMVSLGLIGFGIYSVSTKIYFEPPMPKVTIKDTKIPTTQGSYCWKVIGMGRCVDKVYASPFEMGQEHTPVAVQPNSKIDIQFNSEPLPGSLVVEEWVNENTSDNVEIKDNKITVPSQKGIYIYHITSNWQQEIAVMLFSIEIE